MKLLTVRAALILVFVLVFALTACGESENAAEPTTPPLEEPAATETPPAEEASEPTQAPAEVEGEPTLPTPTEDDAAEQAAEEEPVENESEIPLDLPIVEGAQNLEIQRALGSITYMVADANIQEVVDFYTTEMTELGWESRTASQVGLMASLIFEKEGSRVSASLQENNIAHTVNIRLFIHER
jgi:type IV secretory pathway VirB10-like protein